VHPLIMELRNIRVQARQPADDVAYKIGVSRAAVSHWETGRKEPTIDHLCEYAASLGYKIIVAKDRRATDDSGSATTDMRDGGMPECGDGRGARHEAGTSGLAGNGMPTVRGVHGS
jgi:transcriptional regulator with XRE-family HTH domain